MNQVYLRVSRLALILIVLTLTALASSTPAGAATWPGGTSIVNSDATNALGSNLSGLAYEASGSSAPGVLWAVKNSPSRLYRLVWNGTIWTPDTSNSWSAGKALRYPAGTGDPDAEGITFAGASAAGGVYVGAERNNSVSTTSRNSILRFNAAAAGTTLTPTNEWNLTADLPATGENAGLEAITWLPDAFLVSEGLIDESTSQVYDPADYPNHGPGLFFAGLEANGMVYAYALDHSNNAFDRIASFASGFSGVMALEFARDRELLWAVCDNTCSGQSAILEVDALGHFAPSASFNRSAGMANLNNEGFAISSDAECAGGFKPVIWADDGNTSGHALRRGTLSCAPPATDTDNDGVADDTDNCDRAPNPTQQDKDNDTKGDACDADGLIPPACSEITIDAVFIGTSGKDTITGTPFNDLVLTKGGDDMVDAGAGDNCIDGGAGKDSITTGAGNDVILGQAGNDTINAGNGANTVDGGSGKDSIITGSGPDQIDDPDGITIVQSGGGGDGITTAGDADVICTGVYGTFGTFTSCIGGAGNDVVNAGSGSNKINTGAGADNVTTGAGNDRIDCGTEADTAHAGTGTDVNVGGRCETFAP